MCMCAARSPSPPRTRRRHGLAESPATADAPAPHRRAHDGSVGPPVLPAGANRPPRIPGSHRPAANPAATPTRTGVGLGPGALAATNLASRGPETQRGAGAAGLPQMFAHMFEQIFGGEVAGGMWVPLQLNTVQTLGARAPPPLAGAQLFADDVVHLMHK